MATHRANEETTSVKDNELLAQDISVYMHLDNLEDVPDYPLPAGYEIRSYRPGDDAAWLEIHIDSDTKNTFTKHTFRRQFGTNIQMLESRQFFICTSDGSVIGTAAAWFKGDLGLVHWVAIRTEYQGRGLAKPLLSAVCNRLRELGHKEACLNSSSSRLPALCLYSLFGFRPGAPPVHAAGERIFRSDREKAVWEILTPVIASRISKNR